jgi:hypothetical protein
MNDYDHDYGGTDACQALLLALEWLPGMRDLVSVSLTNKTLLSLVPKAEHLWKPFREAISGSFALHDHIDTSDWDDPTVPPCDTNSYDYRYGDPPKTRGFHLRELKIPPRCHAGGPFNSGFYRGHYHPHPRDRAACRHPKNLLLDGNFFHQINEQGQLEDRFFDAADADNWSFSNIISAAVWIPRTFPCECQYCPRIVLQDQKSLIQHCLTYNHRDNAKKDHDSRVPLEFVDPRHDPSYSSLDEFQKVRRLVQYRTKVLNALGAPSMADEELANMNRLLTVINVQLACSLEAGYGDDNYIFRALCFLARPDALECVIGACIDESVESFRRDGMACGCLDVIVNGRANYFGWVPFEDGYEVDEMWENFFIKVVSRGERNDS